MTTQDKPAVGPLSAGDVLRHDDGQVYVARDVFQGWVYVADWRAPVSEFAFIGRPGPDGWIKAPEGGWKENPVPGQRVEYLMRGHLDEGSYGPDQSDECIWVHTHEDHDIIAFRLAPTAPVEADCGIHGKVPGPVCIRCAELGSPMGSTAPVEAGGSEDKQATSGAGLVANLASYCGGETQGCTDISPCCDCLKMANVFERGADPFGAYVAQLGDLLRPQQEPTT